MCIILEDGINWIKLQRISKEVVGKEVEITLTTMLDREKYRAVMTSNGGKVQVVLSANNKSANQVIDALAHELAHATLNSDSHDATHSEEKKRIKNVLIKNYKEDSNEI